MREWENSKWEHWGCSVCREPNGYGLNVHARACIARVNTKA